MKIDLSYMHNLRDIGGMKTIDNKTIKSGYLFRSGHLRKVSKKDINIINDLHLDNIIDFRNPIEFEQKADYRFDRVTYYNFSAMKETEKDLMRYKSGDSNMLALLDKEKGGKIHMIKTYENFAKTTEAISAYQNFFKILTEKRCRTLWHCSQGKDRAGIAAYLLELALGVSEEDARCDYLLTNEAMELKIIELTPFALRAHQGDESCLPILEEVFQAKEEYLDAFIASAVSESGSVMNFITDTLKVDIEKLRSFYLE